MKKQLRSPLSILVALGIGCLGTSSNAALNIVINAGSGLSSNAAAMMAFQRAAEEWSVYITNDITIYVDADLNDFGAGNTNVIGSTGFASYASGSADLNFDYSIVKAALAAQSTTLGKEVLAHLPDTLQANVPSGSTFIGSTIGVLRANQRALGLIDNSDTRADGFIDFNSSFAFDYDRFDADGVGSGKMDFQTVAAHEIGHLLGFISDVDEFDAGYLLTNLTTLDLFRFNAANVPLSFLEFKTFARELRPGAASVFSDTVNVYGMSTGFTLGDGQQASHWQDDIYAGYLIGMMDPNLSYGSYRPVDFSDLRALELMGYSIVPEPGIPGLLALAFTLSGIFHRRRPIVRAND